MKKLGEIQEHERIKEKVIDPGAKIWVSKWTAVITSTMMTKRIINTLSSICNERLCRDGPGEEREK